jgi:salicylate hydroxylase
MATIPYRALVGNKLIAPYLDVLNNWWGPNGVVVTGPLNAHGELTYTLEFCMMDNSPHAGGSTPRFVKRADISHNWEAWDPALTELLSYCDDYFVWPLAYADPTLDWMSESGKIVLIGDAAHGVLPYVGAVSSSSTFAHRPRAATHFRPQPPTPSHPLTRSY